MGDEAIVGCFLGGEDEGVEEVEEEEEEEEAKCFAAKMFIF